ncbi:4-coumarate--CoA ligase-like 9 [Fagus crenata]
MDQAKPPSPVDPNSGFNTLTKTFHSLRPPIHLPPQNIPISAADYAFSLRQLNSPWPDSLALINSSTGQRVSYSDFTRKTQTLASYFQSVIGLTKGDTAFVLSQNLIQVPILYFSLLSLGVVISPANPLSTESEISTLIQICKPDIAFASSSSAHKLQNTSLRFKTILLDSPEFDSMMTSPIKKLDRVEVSQSDLAAILYSSGTTGRVKGVMLTHRNVMAPVSGSYAHRTERKSPAVLLYTMPYFHVFGFSYCFKSVALSETAVIMERFDMRKMLRAVEEFRVTHVALTPPVVMMMTKSDVTDGYDLSSLEEIVCGAATLAKDVIPIFTAKFPSVVFVQCYGLTEAMGVFRTWGPEESLHWGATGRVSGGFEAKIVKPDTGNALAPGKQGELWIRGPAIMKGYIGDPEATTATLVGDGWLRTGDLCYIDEEGFLFFVDRLKELIKYKGYQVAPAELENLLQSHPEIVDAAVIPYPDEATGQVPMAFVVRQPQSCLGKAEIMDFVAKQVAPYKKIRHVAFVNSLPKSAAGKLLRKELRKIVSTNSSSRL